MISDADLVALRVTLQLAGLTTLILLVLGTPLAWWLARSRWRFKFLVEAVVALPLVLPPTVLGFYLLVTLGPQGPVGSLMEAMGGRPLAFTFAGLPWRGQIIPVVGWAVSQKQCGPKILKRSRIKGL